MRTYNHTGKLKHPVTLEFDGYTLTLEADQEISLHVVVDDETLKLERAAEEIRRLRKLLRERPEPPQETK